MDVLAEDWDGLQELRADFVAQCLDGGTILLGQLGQLGVVAFELVAHPCDPVGIV